MRALRFVSLVLTAFALFYGAASAGEHATPEEAKATAIHAAEYLKAIPPEKRLRFSTIGMTPSSTTATFTFSSTIAKG